MKWLNCTEAPLRLYGLNHIELNKGEYWRLPTELIAKMPQYELLGRRAVGSRLRFCTDAPKVHIRFTMSDEKVDRAMGLPAAAGIDVYIGSGPDSRYAGYVAPAVYGYKDISIEGEIIKKAAMETVTLNLPRNEALSSLEIGVGDEYAIEASPEYRIKNPIVFYGSSITEGGCAPRPGTAYTSIVARWLDADYYNYGFSGRAKGELVFAEFIAGHENMSAFVMDYDHNAPSPEHLAQTHRPFFELIRKERPTLPVVIMTRPDFDRDPEDSELRRRVVYETYNAAVLSGDKNTYFVDGQQFFGQYGRDECTIDGCHPNALGFMRMAEVVYPLLRRIVG
jgi:lysophospholipase L1-like esterase